MDHYELICNIDKKRPFIYKIKGEFYLLGAGVYRKCNDREIGLHQNLMQEFKRLQSRVNSLSHLTDSDVSNLSEMFNELYGIYNFIDSSGQRRAARQDIATLILSLNGDEVKNIEQQILDYHSIMNLTDGAFYCESDVYKERGLQK